MTDPTASTNDRVNLNLWGLHLSVTRNTESDVPSELTVVIPRAEIRQSCPGLPEEGCNTEIILSSITVVIAPRHPPEKTT